MDRDGAAPVLIFRIGSLGDTVVALPVFHEIRRRHPHSRILLLTNTPVDGGIRAASTTQVLEGTGLVDEYIEYPHGSLSPVRLLAVIRALRRLGPRRCYFLMPDRSPAQAWRDRLFFRLAGVRDTVGLDPAGNAMRPPLEPGGLWEAEARRLMRIVGAGDRELTPQDFSLHLSEHERSTAAQALNEGGVRGRFVVFCIGTKHPANDWGDAKWSACLRDFGAIARDHALVAVGSAVEAGRSAGLLLAWPGATLNLCGRLLPRQSAAVLERASLFLGHDSGPTHLACAVRAPVVAVYSGRNRPGVWFPFGQEDNVVRLDVPCMGCALVTCVAHANRCLTGIEPARVVQRAARVLDASREGSPGRPVQFVEPVLRTVRAACGSGS